MGIGHCTEHIYSIGNYKCKIKASLYPLPQKKRTSAADKELREECKRRSSDTTWRSRYHVPGINEGKNEFSTADFLSTGMGVGLRP